MYKPKGLKVLGAMCMVRNSIGSGKKSFSISLFGVSGIKNFVAGSTLHVLDTKRQNDALKAHSHMALLRTFLPYSFRVHIRHCKNHAHSDEQEKNDPSFDF